MLNLPYFCLLKKTHWLKTQYASEKRPKQEIPFATINENPLLKLRFGTDMSLKSNGFS